MRGEINETGREIQNFCGSLQFEMVVSSLRVHVKIFSLSVQVGCVLNK